MFLSLSLPSLSLLQDVVDVSTASQSGYWLHEIQLVERQMALQAAQRRVRIHDSFLDFDAKRSGEVTPHQFRQGLRRCFRLPITEAQMAALIDKYSLKGVVRYAEFEKAISSLIATMAGGGETAVPGAGLGALANQEASLLDDVLAACRTVVANRRLLLTPTFQDFDRRRTSHVTADQFTRVLSTSGMLPPTDGGLQVLLKAYAATEGRHPPTGFVNYRRFVADVDPAMAGGSAVAAAASSSVAPSGLPAISGVTGAAPTMKGSKSSSVLNAVAEGKPALSASASTPALSECARDTPTLLAAVRTYVHQRRVRLKEAFRDDDKLRKGMITRAQFYRGLNLSLGAFGFTPAEIATLADEYSSPSVVDGQGRPYVKWAAFVADVDKVFTLGDLEKTPCLDVAAEVTGARRSGGGTVSLGGATASPLDAADEEAVASAVSRLAEYVRVKGLELTPFFEDFDRANRGCVTVGCFKRVLSMVGLLPIAGTAPELEALCLKFKETATISIYDSHHHPDVNYKAFVHALKLATVGDAAAHADPAVSAARSVGGASGLMSRTPTAAEFRSTVSSLPPPLVDDGSASVAGAHTLSLAGIDSVPLAKGRPQEGPLPTGGGYAGGAGGRPAAALVVADIVAQMKARRIRLHDFLTDGDKLRSGEISGARFRSALGRAGLTLTSADLDVLGVAFASRKRADLVDWRSFAAAMADGLTGLDGVEAAATATAALAPPAHHNVDKRALGALLEKIATFVRHRGLHMKPYFQDYDPHNACQVTRTQAGAVLDKMKLGLNDAERELLCKAFEAPQGLHPTGQIFINYKALVKNVDAVETY